MVLFCLLLSSSHSFSDCIFFCLVQISALAIIFTIFTVNFLIGFLPFIDNFANIGGFISGFLLGFVLLFKPQLRQMPPSHKGKLFEDDMNRSTRLKEQFDRPVLRIICLLVFCGM